MSAAEMYRPTLFQKGFFHLASGQSSGWKIECDALTPADWLALAAMAVERFGRPRWVEGVPSGGIPFADALKPYQQEGGHRWIVDDVLTTGGSMERQRGRRTDVLGVVVFARGQCPLWVHPLFQMGGPA